MPCVSTAGSVQLEQNVEWAVNPRAAGCELGGTSTEEDISQLSQLWLISLFSLPGAAGARWFLQDSSSAQALHGCPVLQLGATAAFILKPPLTTPERYC